MKILLIGKGKMANVFEKIYHNEVVKQIDNNEEFKNFDQDYDCAVDFSYSGLIEEVLNISIKNKKPLLIGTTNYSSSQKELIYQASKIIPICLDSNYSLGILYLKKCIDSLMYYPFDNIRIIETHHVTKKDIPSGTALSLKQYIQRYYHHDIEIISYRRDDICGIHKIEFINKDESISLIHDAKNRDIFAYGAREALAYLVNKKNGLYTFKEIINA